MNAPPPGATGDLADLQHPRFARAYEWISRRMDERGGLEHRRRLLEPLAGRVIEVGSGNGRNFAHYPTSVTAVVAVEPEGVLRSAAERAASKSPVPVTVAPGRADRLPGDDGEYDAAVMSLVLCSITDPDAALTEVRRVLRTGGTLRFYEHVRSRRRPVGLFQDAISPLWSRLFGGCRLNRETTAVIGAAGFETTEVERFSFSGVAHVIGAARAL
ncbi:MAG: class I SAM-dependent methyltransferase [Thermocrispum sp.]